MSWEDGAAPEGWQLCTLGEVTTVVGGGTPKTSVPGNFSGDEGHPWITPADLTGYEGKFIARGRRFLTDQGLASSSAKFMPAGTVLFSSRAPIGYVAIAANPVTTNQGFRSFIPSDSLSPDYLYHALRFLRPVAERLASGTTFAELSGSKAKAIHLAFPGFEEQVAIACLLDTANELGRTASEHLAATRRAVERFRESVLAAACSGRLTADWRDRNPSTVSEKLIPRDSDNVDGLADVEDLPEGWVLAQVGDVGDVQLGGTPSRKVGAFWNGDIPWVSSGEVANCRIAATREAITPAGLAGSSAKLYPAGTVLIAMIGEGKTRGQSAILDIEACTNQNAAGVIPDRRFVHPEYLWRWALAQYEVTRAVGRGGNQPALNKQKVRELTIAVPPLAEQAEVVRRIDQVLLVSDGLHRRLDVAAARLNRSSQAVLTKAFRGELLVGTA